MKLISTKVDKVELEAKIASMRILENVDLPASIQAMIPPKPVVKKKEKVKKNAVMDTITAAAKAVTETITGATNVAKGKSHSNGKTDVEEEIEEEEEEEVVAPVKPKATVRMANLCVIAGHKVNGVAAIHSEIVKDEVFNDFYKVSDLPLVARAFYLQLPTFSFFCIHGHLKQDYSDPRLS